MVADRYSFFGKQYFEPFDLGRAGAAKEVDPHARIDKNHLSFLIASRSPSH
jgi:hypothetical protein